jgi:hypothetical protein
VFQAEKLDADELSILLSGSPKEQRQILWIAVCRRSP